MSGQIDAEGRNRREWRHPFIRDFGHNRWLLPRENNVDSVLGIVQTENGFEVDCVELKGDEPVVRQNIFSGKINGATFAYDGHWTIFVVGGRVEILANFWRNNLDVLAWNVASEEVRLLGAISKPCLNPGAVCTRDGLVVFRLAGSSLACETLSFCDQKRKMSTFRDVDLSAIQQVMATPAGVVMLGRQGELDVVLFITKDELSSTEEPIGFSPRFLGLCDDDSLVCENLQTGNIRLVQLCE